MRCDAALPCCDAALPCCDAAMPSCDAAMPCDAGPRCTFLPLVSGSASSWRPTARERRSTCGCLLASWGHSPSSPVCNSKWNFQTPAKCQMAHSFKFDHQCMNVDENLSNEIRRIINRLFKLWNYPIKFIFLPTEQTLFSTLNSGEGGWFVIFRLFKSILFFVTWISLYFFHIL